VSLPERNDDAVPCYLGVCPSCRGAVAICVADPANPGLMQHALKERRAWERAGLTIETLSVHEGKSRLRAQFGHVEGCAKDRRRAKRETPKQQNLTSDVRGGQR
jgi:hypothetical protein